MSLKTSIILCTYNEARYIENAISELEKNISNLELVIVDDFSTDGTIEIIKKLNQDNKYKVIFRKKRRNLASAFVRGLTDTTGEYIGWIDTNMGELASRFPEMIKELKFDNDLILMSRYIEGGGDDRIFIENFAPCWPEFDVEKHTGVKITQGIYQQEISDTNICPYIFYSYSVNADGLVSSCFLDWQRKLAIGDVRTESMKEIWNSKKMNKLRLLHLNGNRNKCETCSSCGQLTHCLPDNIDCIDITWGTGLKEYVRCADLVMNPSLWSAPIEGALVKSASYNKVVATVQSKYGFESEVKEIKNHIRLSNDIEIAAKQLADYLSKQMSV